MIRTRSPEPAHDFIHDEQSTELIAYTTHGFEISSWCGSASQSLRMYQPDVPSQRFLKEQALAYRTHNRLGDESTHGVSPDTDEFFLELRFQPRNEIFLCLILALVT